MMAGHFIFFFVELPWTCNHLREGLDFAWPRTPVLAQIPSVSSVSLEVI